jgi:hypothetical protein
MWQVVVNVVVGLQVQQMRGIISFRRRAVLLGYGHVIVSETRSVWQHDAVARYGSQFNFLPLFCLTS